MVFLENIVLILLTMFRKIIFIFVFFQYLGQQGLVLRGFCEVWSKDFILFFWLCLGFFIVYWGELIFGMFCRVCLYGVFIFLGSRYCCRFSFIDEELRFRQLGAVKVLLGVGRGVWIFCFDYFVGCLDIVIFYIRFNQGYFCFVGVVLRRGVELEVVLELGQVGCSER